MRNNFIKVNIRNVQIYLGSIILFVFLLLTSGLYNPSFAAIPETDSGGSTSGFRNNSAIREILNLLGGGPDDEQYYYTEDPTDPNISPVYPSPYNQGNITAYRQCNYRSTTMHNGCTLCYAGCGLTAASITLSAFGIKVDPPAMNNKYRELGLYAGCSGSHLASAKTVIEKYGLKTSQYLFGGGVYTIEEVAPDIRAKVKSGWIVFVLTHFCSGGCGHFIVITDIDEANRVTSYDPYYEPPESSIQPISYQARYPFPKYIAGFAVRK
ncbi:hypothetical protein COY16_03870 [Candidatus Roizmanbacteria bacterium CG_4_10_14_0_2_um_filter_39_13]|uniref:Peptidase C39-like domain-containing protein n=1 Tax=Candidatus Roizmanbacteria bacterium CG_4_10_14_0_2_um_filter_39_13 TaxID=1974825 RepID=A0A2M7TXP1_9BACT|nr:MAG: hypothetical protein COY16_03870 [Candidatus Roizmanbacteria bacterium CG_4_10_14_0_2_um_filter_39_13]